MSKAIAAVTLLVAAWPAAGQAVDGQTLARANQCLACHQVDSKRVGPSFQAVAERYAGKDNVEDYLAQSVRQGGRGRWGAIPMPAQPQVDEAEARDLARWILSLDPGR